MRNDFEFIMLHGGRIGLLVCGQKDDVAGENENFQLDNEFCLCNHGDR